MSSANSQTLALRLLKGLLRRIASVLAECRYAQNRMIVLGSAPDRHVAKPNEAPDTYAEFLYRTSGMLMHEPSARARARNRSGSLPR
jgi:hypothetical protein